MILSPMYIAYKLRNTYFHTENENITIKYAVGLDGDEWSYCWFQNNI